MKVTDEGNSICGAFAFMKCTTLEKIVIPKSVTQIGYDPIKNGQNSFSSFLSMQFARKSNNSFFISTF